MSKHDMSQYQRIRTTGAVFLSTLATNTGVVLQPGATLAQEIRLTSAVIQFAVAGVTDGEGPILVGVAHPDYTLAEIEEAIESTLVNASDMVGREKANRRVREVGILSGNGQLNDGKPLKVKLNWFVADGSIPLTYWAYNLSAGTLTTGGIFTVAGHLNCFWS